MRGARLPLTVNVKPFGTPQAGLPPLYHITICARNGVAATLTNFGATLLSVHVPDERGKVDNVTHNHATA